MPRSSGPNDETLARTWAPVLPDRDRTSIGWPGGLERPGERLAALHDLRVRRVTGRADPRQVALDVDRENRDTEQESCPAKSCSVFVLPVPVAPAISPWRLTRDSAQLDAHV